VWTPISKEYPARLQLGETAAGLNRVRDEKLDRASAELEAQMFREYRVDDGRAVFFTDPAHPERQVILLVATKLILDPGKEIEKGIKGVSDRPVHDLTDYSRLGGHQKCATTEDDDKQPVVICAWTDHGSVGLGIFYGSWTMDTCATVLRDLRLAVVGRG